MRSFSSIILFVLLPACLVDEERDASCGDLDYPTDPIAITDDEPVELRVIARRGRRLGPTVAAAASGDVTAALERQVDRGTLQIACSRRPGEGQVTFRTSSGECEPIEVDCIGDEETEETEETEEGPHLDPIEELPPYTTTCGSVDADNCVTTDSQTCHVVLDGSVMGGGANVALTGTLIRSPALGVIEVGVYTEPDKYEVGGPGAALSLSGTTLTRKVYGAYASSPLASETHEVPADGDLELTFLTVVERDTGYVTLETDIAGVTTAALLEATAEAPPTNDQVVVTLKQARVCGMAVGEF